jgi:hypothetical protein
VAEYIVSEIVSPIDSSVASEFVLSQAGQQETTNSSQAFLDPACLPLKDATINCPPPWPALVTIELIARLIGKHTQNTILGWVIARVIAGI